MNILDPCKINCEQKMERDINSLFVMDDGYLFESSDDETDLDSGPGSSGPRSSGPGSDFDWSEVSPGPGWVIQGSSQTLSSDSASITSTPTSRGSSSRGGNPA